MYRLLLVSLPLVFACGAPTKQETLWRGRIETAMSQRNFHKATADYAEYRASRGSDDVELLRKLATDVLWQGLRVPAADIRIAAIEAVERREVEDLAGDVIENMGNNDDAVAAAAAVAVLRSHPSAPSIASEMLESRDPRARRTVIRGLARKFKELARADFVRALADADVGVRLAAVDALASISRPEDVTLLLKTAREDKEPRVRARALRSIDVVNNQVVAVASAVLRDSFVGSKLAALAVLEKDGRSASIAIIERALDEPDPIVRLRAATALIALGNNTITSHLDEGLSHEQPAVRISAIHAASRVLSKERAVQTLEGMFRDRDIEVRLAAARAALALGAKQRAVGVLTAALGSDNIKARLDAATDLARVGDPQGKKELVALTQHEQLDTRSAALRAYARKGAELAPIIAGLADTSIRLRILAAELLLELTADA